MPMHIAVNLSPAQFMHGDLVNLADPFLLETGLAPDRLELEITEGVLIEDFDRGLALLRRLKALGVRISMDHFGSGYSSLSYLQAFPFDKIKIDRAFVINLGKQPSIGGDRPRRHPSWPRPRHVDRGRGRRDIGAAGVPGRGRLRRGAGLSPRQARRRSAICGTGRPQNHHRRWSPRARPAT